MTSFSMNYPGAVLERVTELAATVVADIIFCGWWQVWMPVLLRRIASNGLVVDKTTPVWTGISVTVALSVYSHHDWNDLQPRQTKEQLRWQQLILGIVVVCLDQPVDRSSIRRPRRTRRGQCPPFPALLLHDFEASSDILWWLYSYYEFVSSLVRGRPPPAQIILLLISERQEETIQTSVSHKT